MECEKCGKKHDGMFGSGRFCSIKCANSRVFSESSRLKKSIKLKGNIPANKGKRPGIVISKCKLCGGDIKHLKSTPKKYHPDCWKKVSGGYRKGSGVGKSGWYKGIWCDSSYELAWVIYHMEKNIPFIRNKRKYEYIWEGKKYNYYPDFIVNGDIIEIKGYTDNKTNQKLKSVENLIVLFKDDLKDIFEYVINKYGKNYTELYEKK
jgi:hypothetical protein